MARYRKTVERRERLLRQLNEASDEGVVAGTVPELVRSLNYPLSITTLWLDVQALCMEGKVRWDPSPGRTPGTSTITVIR